jgi:transcription initiation factor TFIIIB Brf1 subunit/transcription initiation factor TFIIB
MSDLEKLEIWEKVNKTQSLEDLAKIILLLADESGLIQGRTRKFVAKDMANACINFKDLYPTVLTREFGIRKQAFYILKIYE